MKEFYDTYWTKEHPPPTVDPLTPQRLDLLWSLTAALPEPPRRMLDCGSGEGHLVAAAMERGLEAEGIEISGQALDRSRATKPDLRIHSHSVEERPWPVPDERFDLVTSFEVIEHLVRPRELLLGAFGALRPGGYLALSTPRHGLLKNLALVAFAFDRHFDVDGGHIRFFSDQALGRLLTETGFEVRRMAYFGRHWPLWADVFVWARKP